MLDDVHVQWLLRLESHFLARVPALSQQSKVDRKLLYLLLQSGVLISLITWPVAPFAESIPGDDLKALRKEGVK